MELVLNLDALDRNLRRMADRCAAAGVQLRPHTKTHRSPWVAQRQIALGAAGVAAATLDDTEWLVKAGVSDVLLTSPFALAAVDRYAELAELATLSVVVDGPALLLALADAARARGLVLPVLVDVDVGQHRTGVEPHAAVDLAELAGDLPASASPGCRGTRGTACSRPAPTPSARSAPPRPTSGSKRPRPRSPTAASRSTGSRARAPAPTSWPSRAGVFTELQPGSYCVMDTSYQAAIGDGFETALYVVATVVSKRKDGVTVDAGWKAISVDAGPPAVHGAPRATYQFAGDEHGLVTGVQARVGDTIALVPGHCDTTIHLHRQYTLVRDDGRTCGTLPIRSTGLSRVGALGSSGPVKRTTV